MDIDETFLPIFYEYPEEAAVIGRLVAGYGELEYDLASCVWQFTHNEIAGLKALFRIRTESGRIQVADAIMRDAITEKGLGPQYDDAYGAMRHCLKIRNQYAHCHWFRREVGDPLGFITLEEGLKGANASDLTLKRVPLELLEEQESYFRYAQLCWWHIHNALARLDGRKFVDLPMPPKRPQPNLYSPLETPQPDSPLAT